MKTGGQAFPRPSSEMDGNFCNPSQEGMTLRDYFAAKAMQGIVWDGVGREDAAKRAYAIADAMLAEREKE